MKPGDKVKLRGNRKLHCYKLISTDSVDAVVEDYYTKLRSHVELAQLIPTSMTPTLFVTTYGDTWSDNVSTILTKGLKGKVKFHTINKNRDSRMIEWYVDARKLKEVKDYYEEFYKQGLAK